MTTIKKQKKKIMKFVAATVLGAINTKRITWNDLTNFEHYFHSSFLHFHVKEKKM